MALGHLPHDGQAHACARILLGAVQALEDAEDAIVVLHVESDAAVGDGDHRVAALPIGADADHAAAGGAELHGIRQEIGQRLSQPVALADHLGERQLLGDREATRLDLVLEIAQQRRQQ